MRYLLLLMLVSLISGCGTDTDTCNGYKTEAPYTDKEIELYNYWLVEYSIEEAVYTTDIEQAFKNGFHVGYNDLFCYDGYMNEEQIMAYNYAVSCGEWERN